MRSVRLIFEPVLRCNGKFTEIVQDNQIIFIRHGNHGIRIFFQCTAGFTTRFLSEIIDRLLTLRRYYDDYRPILLKVSPDIPESQLDEIIDLVLVSGLDGVIATNTTQSREGLKSSKEEIEAIGNGGLSGAPLFERSLERVRYIHKKTEGQLPIIAVGGIMTPEQAHQMLQAGASLVEIYSGFIYNGPGFVKEINKYLAKKL